MIWSHLKYSRSLVNCWVSDLIVKFGSEIMQEVHAIGWIS